MNLNSMHTTVFNDIAADQPAPAQHVTQRDKLLELLGRLDAAGYDFLAPTPNTQSHVLSRADRQQAKTLVDVLGWSLPVAHGTLDAQFEKALIDAEVLLEDGHGSLLPQLRVSRIEGSLFWHSAYPTDAEDAIFLGPDSYRFAQLILSALPQNAQNILDYGAGAGVGGIIAAKNCGGALLTLADVNPKALNLASINAEHAGVMHQTIQVQSPKDLQQRYDLIVTHPPFMMDSKQRAYRDGGDLYGGQLSLDWTLESWSKLTPHGRFIMHSGASIVCGEDVLRSALQEQFQQPNGTLIYRELEPDIFGEELSEPAYADVDRIAAVGIIIDRGAE